MRRSDPLLLGLTLLLAACSLDHLDESEIPAYTKDWVRESDGQVLQFRNGAGQTHQLDVVRREGAVTATSRYTTSTIAYLRVRYRDQTDSTLNFFVENNIAELHFSHHPDDSLRALLHTEKKPGHMLLYSGNAQGLRENPRLITTDTTIGGQQYKYVAHLRLRPYRPSADPVTDIYVSRYEGVVAMRTTRGGLWLRQ